MTNEQRIKIEGYGVMKVTDAHIGGYPTIECDGMEFVVFPNRGEAGEAAREYWQYMVDNDPGEFVAMVGEETLLAWALNQDAGPGTTKVAHLEEWLDLHLDVPEEHFASYDGLECEIERIGNLILDLGWEEYEEAILECNFDGVAYRWN